MLLKMEAGSGDAVVQVDRYDDMPPGFRFHPTDEEIITYYLLNKVMDTRFAPFAMGVVDLNNSEPWDLPRKAKMGENEWFFFCEKDRKYQRGMRTNRATESGYWKATGKDREIFNSKKKSWLVGMKKTLVFYKGRAPKGERTDWVMHEYRLHGNFPNHNFSTTAKEKWVVCKVFHKKIGTKTSTTSLAGEELAKPVDSLLDNLLDNPTLPPFRDYSISTNQNPITSSFATDQEDDEVKPDFSSSNYQLQMLQHNQNNFIAPPPLIISPHNLNPNPILNPQNFHPDSFIPYQPPSLVYHQNIYPDSRALEPCNMYIGGMEAETMCKTEGYSLNDSIVSHSQGTGALSHEMATEISSVQYCKGDTESKKASDQEFEGLDYLWSY